MPPRMGVFKNMGSQDDTDVPATGLEFFKALKFYRNKTFLFLSALFSIIGGVMPVLMNLFLGDLMTTFFANTTDVLGPATDIVINLAIVFGVMDVVMGLNFYFRTTANPMFVVDLRKALFGSLMEQEIAFFDQNPTGVLISRLSEDVTLVRETYIDKGLSVVQSLVQSVAGIIMAFVISWKVSLVIVVALPIVALIFYLGEKKIDDLWVHFNKTSTTAASKAEEVISQFRTVKAFDCELKEADIYSHSLDDVNRVYDKAANVHATKDGLIHTIANCISPAVLYFTCYLIIEKPDSGLESGSMMTIMMSIMFAVMGISQAVGSIDDFRKANVAAAKIFSIIERKPAVDRFAGNPVESIKGDIEFKDVSFKYQTAEDYAVKDLSFKIEAGQTVAFVGESGCGKTTTLQLLQRFYEIESGSILIDGVDIREYSSVSLRSQIAIVPQSPVLFSMSIKDNIRYSKTEATDEEIANAAKIGNAHNFIMELNDNYDCTVQQTSLSGGQKQRICISRAILANAPILLLDEATAALDTESEQLVQESLEKFRHGKTALIVAHRLATVKNADKIFVFQSGKVVEIGTHEELMNSGGIYADLVKFQLQ